MVGAHGGTFAEQSASRATLLSKVFTLCGDFFVTFLPCEPENPKSNWFDNLSTLYLLYKFSYALNPTALQTAPFPNDGNDEISQGPHSRAHELGLKTHRALIVLKPIA